MRREKKKEIEISNIFVTTKQQDNLLYRKRKSLIKKTSDSVKESNDQTWIGELVFYLIDKDCV